MGQLISKISNRLQTLEDIEGVKVTVNDSQKTIYIQHQTHQSLNFKFIWSKNHYIGYFLDGDDNKSQAVLSLWKPIEAIHFATAYCLLIDLRAGRK